MIAILMLLDCFLSWRGVVAKLAGEFVDGLSIATFEVAAICCFLQTVASVRYSTRSGIGSYVKKRMSRNLLQY